MKSVLKISLTFLLILPIVAVQAQPAQPDDQVYEFIAVDVKPALSRDSQPVYPQSAIDAGVEGTVVVSIVVGKDGSVTSATIFSSIPELDNAALQAARSKVYSPGMLGGVAVNTKMNIPVEFVLPSAPRTPPPATTSAPAEEPGDFVDLTGEAVRITIEPERPRVNIIADRIKPEFGNINLEKSFIPELLGRAERIEIVSRSKEEALKPIDTKQVLNRAR